jgi:hypothetical protein
VNGLEIRATLRARANAIGPNWAPFPVLLAGEPYLAKWIEGSDLDGVSLFQLLAALPETHAAMGELSLVVTGKTGAGGRAGFILLAGRSAPGSGNKWGRRCRIIVVRWPNRPKGELQTSPRSPTLLGSGQLVDKKRELLGPQKTCA